MADHTSPFFSAGPDYEFGSESDPDPPALLSLDLFRCRHPSPPMDMEPPDFLTLGLGFPDQEEEEEELGRDWTGDEFFIGRRSPGPDPSSEFSRARLIDEDGLRILGFDSESDTDDDEQIVAIGSDPEEPGLPLCWDCLRIDDDDDRREIEIGEGFEWERIDERAAAVNERDVFSLMVVAAEEHENGSSVAAVREEGSEEEGMAAMASNWEVLLTMHQFGDSSEDYADSSYFVEEHDHEDGFVYTSEYGDVLFTQFQEQEASLKGGPPAARSVVEGLPTVALEEEEDVGEGPVNCAVCKDEFSAKEEVKRLPCRHYYHEECILPWLGMRNTCPLCRYELPTDDVEYESRKARRAGSVEGLEEEEEEEEERVRYDFEILLED